MNYKIKLISLLLFIVTYGVFGEEVKTEFKVFGNCGMCEKRIENAVLSLNGVLKASWNDKTNMMDVIYNDSLVDIREIHMAIAVVGHDTDLIFSHEDIFKSLPVCCRYDRPEEIIYGMNRIVSVPPGCNPKKMSAHNNSCCNETIKN